MASPGGISSGSSSLQQNSSSEEDMQVQIMDERKRKRMQSNRESARRSRMRKQKHLDDLMNQVSNLRKGNNQLLNNIDITTQHFLKIDAENSILRAQMSELSNRLQSLNEINNVLSSSNSSSNNNNNNHNNVHHHHSMGFYGGSEEHHHHGDEFYSMIQEPFASDHNGFLMNNNPWNATTCLNQPIMASANMFQY